MIADMIKAGQIVPSSVTVGLLEKAMNESKQDRFLIDGFPRNQENNGAWEKNMGDKVDFKFILFFDCSEECMKSRLLSRGEQAEAMGQQRRSDDEESVIVKRFNTYKNETRPVIAHYESQSKVVQIDANPSVEEVWATVQEQFEKWGIN